MKISSASVYIREKNDRVVQSNSDNTTKIKLSGDGFKQYVSAIQDGVIEHEGVQIIISDYIFKLEHEDSSDGVKNWDYVKDNSQLYEEFLQHIQNDQICTY